MNIRQAILKAADHIEARPEAFDFGEVYIPDKCGTPGCALGWIAFFTGYEGAIEGLCMNKLGLRDSGEFYDRMDLFEGRSWMKNAELCASALRAYADRYHPAKPTPDWNALATPTAGVLPEVSA